MCGLEGDSGVGDRVANAFKEGFVGVLYNGGWLGIEERLTARPSQMPRGRGGG